MKPLIFIIILILCCYTVNAGIHILSKSKLEKCVKESNTAPLNCNEKIVLSVAVPSESNGRDTSIETTIEEVKENSTDKIKTLSDPRFITISKSAVYAQYELTYIRDVAYKPEEFYGKTRKCRVPQICEPLRDNQGRVIDFTEATCCDCGQWRRMPSSCGNVFDKMRKGKANTAHCVRFPGEWFHVFAVGRHQVGFSIRVQVRTVRQISEVIIGPNNRAATSNDDFMRVNLIGDYAGYTDLPSFDNFYLVIPRQGGEGRPPQLGRNFAKWMLLERVRFTLEGNECNKIGVSYEAFKHQPDFCGAPFGSCLHNQLWHFWDADQNRINRRQVPLYVVQGRFQRINEQPNAGSHSFSIGVTEVINSNLLIELKADDIRFVSQRSNGTIVSITVPSFEALTQFGVATIRSNNTGNVEASYSMTFACSGGISQMEEQFFIMQPAEIITRTFKLYPSTDQAAKYICVAILKDSEFFEIDRAECQFTTTATVIDNGTQIPFEIPKIEVKKGFFDFIEEWWHRFWDAMVNFITGKSCRKKCSGFFDLRCHIRYICRTWVLLFCLFLCIFPTVVVLIWLLHENGLFDPFYDWWEDHCWDEERKLQHMRKHRMDIKQHKKKPKHNTEGPHKREKHKHEPIKREKHKHEPIKREKHKHDRVKGSSNTQHPLYVNRSIEDNNVGETRHKHKHPHPHPHVKRRT